MSVQNFIHMPQIVITWGIYFGCGILLYSALTFSKGGRFSIDALYRYCVPFSIRLNGSFHADLKIYVIDKLFGFIFGIPGFFVTVALCGIINSRIQLLNPSHEAFSLSFIYVSLCTVVIFFFAELADYSWHYAEHKIPVLWELHKVHHSAQILNPLTAKRGHPISLVLAGIWRGILTAVPVGLIMFAFGMSIAEALALSIVASKLLSIISLDPLKHSHHKISLGVMDMVLISPHMHQIHHSKIPIHWDKNFGTNLSLFDWAFGTAYRPKRREMPEYGISSYSDERIKRYNSLYGSYILPLGNIMTIVSTRFNKAQQAPLAATLSDFSDVIGATDAHGHTRS